MPVPKRKVSRSRRDMRRAHLALTAPQLTMCKKCQSPRLPHSVCESCGTYKDLTVPKTALKTDLLALLR